MKRNYLKQAALASLLLAAVVLIPSLASARDVTGSITLPFETRWGKAVLPAGEYSFVINSAAPYTIQVRGQGQAKIFMATDWTQTVSKDSSALLIAREEEKRTLRSLYFKEAGMTVFYEAPGAEREMLAKGGVAILRVPLKVAGK